MGQCYSSRIAPYKISLYEDIVMKESEMRRLLYENKVVDWEEVMEMMFLIRLAENYYGNNGLGSYIWQEMRRKYRMENIIWRVEYRDLGLLYDRVIEELGWDGCNIEMSCFERVNWRMGIRRRVMGRLMDIL